jgi:hypothetical protein
VSDTHRPPFWAEHTLKMVGGKVNHENLRVLNAQSRAEGGTAKWNPLNSTLRLEGFTSATDYTKGGVRNYLYPVAGVCATVLTLESRDANGQLLYPGILNDFQAGTKTAEAIVAGRRAEFVRWAGGDTHYPDLILSILKETP